MVSGRAFRLWAPRSWVRPAQKRELEFTVWPYKILGNDPWEKICDGLEGERTEHVAKLRGTHAGIDTGVRWSLVEEGQGEGSGARGPKLRGTHAGTLGRHL